MQIVVVGGGMQGRVIARNLLAREEKPQVVLVDVKAQEKLEGVTLQQANVLDQDQAIKIAKDADTIVLAVPSSIAHAALSNLIRANKPIVDVSFTPDPPLDLNPLAEANGVCCVVDCGVAPGLSHILVGQAHADFGGLDSARIMVGGIPQTPPPSFHHAIYFNPDDLLAEYVRPARARRFGLDIAPAPMDVPAEKHIDSELGELDAFTSDGLRSLLGSLPAVREMSEWTLRWPGHLDTMKLLYDLGLLSDDKTSSAIAKTLVTKYPADMYPDLLLMQVEAKFKGQQRIWRMLDKSTHGESAMSRTTGYTTAATAMVLARKQFTTVGVHAPERLGKEKTLTAIILEDLLKHGIKIVEMTTVVASH
ncbi:MAG TPA: saccharopine dehydrogenase C-terminal domain-containing protein [Oculatellaceae cyanobacterium]